MATDLQQLVSALPEKYQPIFGHPELSDHASRGCADRLATIIDAYQAIEKQMGRPLRVLDLGCAQGYFSHSLAAQGANVYGVDFLEANIAVCNALAKEQVQYSIRFETARIEDTLQSLQPDQYDLILGLSVFHHIIHEKGIEIVKALLMAAADRVGGLLLEMALRAEPLYWASAQPIDPRELLSEIGFTHQLAVHPTHLTDLPRPLYFASNQFWLVDNQAQRIVSWTKESHALAAGTHQGSRRYFFSQAHVLKHYRLDHPRGEHNKNEYDKEVQFLSHPIAGFTAAQLHAHGESDTESWVVIERLQGVLLVDLLQQHGTIDAHKILCSLLDQLCALEAAGLYHNDIRTWNILIQEGNQPVLIDYGSISIAPEDCAWPHNIYLAFFILVNELVTGSIEHPVPIRSAAMTPASLPPPYDNWSRNIWQRPVQEWSFKLFRELKGEFNSDSALRAEFNAISAQEVWEHAIEGALQVLTRELRELVQSEARNQQAQAQAQLANDHGNSSKAALVAVHNSLSWTLTNPLRIIGRMVINVGQWPHAAKPTPSAIPTDMQDWGTSVSNHEALEGLAQLRNENANLQAQLNAIKNSLSWKFTLPVRWIVGVVLKVIHWIGQLVLKLIGPHLDKYPNFTYKVIDFLRKFPHFHAVLSRALAKTRGMDHNALSQPGSYVVKEPGSGSVRFVWDKSPQESRASDRTIYVHVGHTISSQGNTGIQRVTRRLAAAFMEVDAAWVSRRLV